MTFHCSSVAVCLRSRMVVSFLAVSFLSLHHVVSVGPPESPSSSPLPAPRLEPNEKTDTSNLSRSLLASSEPENLAPQSMRASKEEQNVSGGREESENELGEATLTAVQETVTKDSTYLNNGTRINSDFDKDITASLAPHDHTRDGVKDKPLENGPPDATETRWLYEEEKVEDFSQTEIHAATDGSAKSDSDKLRDWISSLQVRPSQNSYDEDQDENVDTYFDNPKKMLYAIAPRIRAIRTSPDITLRIRSASADDAGLAAHAISHLAKHISARKREWCETEAGKKKEAEKIIQDRRLEQLVECVLCGVDIKSRLLELEKGFQTNGRLSPVKTSKTNASSALNVDSDNDEDDVGLGDEEKEVSWQQSIDMSYFAPRVYDPPLEEDVELDKWGLTVHDATMAATGLSTILLLSCFPSSSSCCNLKLGGEHILDIFSALSLRCRERLLVRYSNIFLSSSAHDNVIDSMVSEEGNECADAQKDDIEHVDLAKDAALAMHAFASVHCCCCAVGANDGNGIVSFTKSVYALFSSCCWILMQPHVQRGTDRACNYFSGDGASGVQNYMMPDKDEKRQIFSSAHGGTNEDSETSSDQNSVREFLGLRKKNESNVTIALCSDHSKGKGSFAERENRKSSNTSMGAKPKVSSSSLLSPTFKKSTKKRNVNKGRKSRNSSSTRLTKTSGDKGDHNEPTFEGRSPLLLDCLSSSLSVKVLWSIAATWYFTGPCRHVHSKHSELNGMSLVRRVRNHLASNIIRASIKVRTEYKNGTKLNKNAKGLDSKATLEKEILIEGKGGFFPEKGNTSATEQTLVVDAAALLAASGENADTEGMTVTSNHSCLLDFNGRQCSDTDMDLEHVESENICTDENEGSVTRDEVLSSAPMLEEIVRNTTERERCATGEKVYCLHRDNNKDGDALCRENEKSASDVSKNACTEKRQLVGEKSPILIASDYFSSRELVTILWSLTEVDENEVGPPLISSNTMNVLLGLLLIQVDKGLKDVDQNKSFEGGDISTLAYVLSKFLRRNSHIVESGSKERREENDLTENLFRALRLVTRCASSIMGLSLDVDEDLSSASRIGDPFQSSGASLALAIDALDLCRLISSLASCVDDLPPTMLSMLEQQKHDPVESVMLARLADRTVRFVFDHTSSFSVDDKAVILWAYATLHTALEITSRESKSHKLLMRAMLGRIIASVELSLEQWAVYESSLSPRETTATHNRGTEGAREYKMQSYAQEESPAATFSRFGPDCRIVPLFGRSFALFSSPDAFPKVTGRKHITPMSYMTAYKLFTVLPFFQSSTWGVGRFLHSTSMPTLRGVVDEIGLQTSTMLKNGTPLEKEMFASNVRDIARVLWSCAILSKSETTNLYVWELVRHMLNFMNRKMNCDSRGGENTLLHEIRRPQYLSMILWSLAELGVQSQAEDNDTRGKPRQSFQERLRITWKKPQLTPEKLSGMSPRSASNMLWGVVSLRDTFNDLVLLNSLLGDVEAKLSLLSSDGLLQTARSVQKLRSSLLNVIANFTDVDSISTDIRSVNAEDERNDVDGEQRRTEPHYFEGRNSTGGNMEKARKLLDHCDRLFGGVADEIVGKLSELSALQLRRLLQVYSVMHTKDDQLLEAIEGEVKLRYSILTTSFSMISNGESVCSHIQGLANDAGCAAEALLILTTSSSCDDNETVRNMQDTESDLKWDETHGRLAAASRQMNRTASAARSISEGLSNLERCTVLNFRHFADETLDVAVFELGRCVELLSRYRKMAVYSTRRLEEKEKIGTRILRTFFY